MVEVGHPRPPRLLVGLLGVLLAVVVMTSLALLWDRRGDAEIEPVRPADIGSPRWTETSAGRAVVAARAAATTYFTLDHTRIEADMDAMRALGTPDFVGEYDARAEALATRIAKDRLVLSATLPRNGTATEDLSTDRAQVLVSVDVTTASAGDARVTRYRTRVALDLVDGTWLIESLDEVA
jgi:hypothetical protein